MDRGIFKHSWSLLEGVNFHVGLPRQSICSVFNIVADLLSSYQTVSFFSLVQRLPTVLLQPLSSLQFLF